MAYPAFQAAGTAVSGTGTVSPTWPTHATDDIALLLVESQNETVTLSVAAGFAEVTGSPVSQPAAGATTATRLTVFWCRATSGAMTAPTVADPGDHVAAQILTFRNCVTTGYPIADLRTRVGGASNATQTMAACIAPELNCLLVAINAVGTDGDSTATWSAWTNDSVWNFTEIADFRTSQGSGGGFGAAAGQFGYTGFTNLVTATLSAANWGACMTLLLKPAVVEVSPGGKNLGHLLDGDTLALWKLDEANLSTFGGSVYDLQNFQTLITAAGEGVPDFTDGPATGTLARTLNYETASPGNGRALTCVTTAAWQSLLIGSWTWEAFIRVDSLPSAGQFDSFWSHSGSFALETAINNSLGTIQICDDGKLRAFWEHSTGIDDTSKQVAGSALSVGTWYHVGIVKDSVANNVLFYLDGVLQDTIAYTNEPDTGTSGAVSLGRNSPSSTRHAHFAIRSLAVSNITRDATWLSNNAALISTTATNLDDLNTYAHWKMDETPIAIDSGTRKLHLRDEGSASPLNISHPTYWGGVISDGGRGRMANNCVLACAFNQDILTALLDDFTFEGWFILFRPTEAAPFNTWGIFDHGDPGSESANDNYFSFYVQEEGALVVDFEHGSGSSSNSTFTTSRGLAPFGTPVHLAFRKTMTGATWTGDVFVNGVNVHTSTGLTNGDGSGNVEGSYFRIGQGNSTATDGIFTADDVRISSVARTDAEILEDYQRGAGLRLPIITWVTSNASPLNPTDVIEVDVTDDNVLSGLQIFVTTTAESVTELIAKNNSFETDFNGNSSRANITGGTRYTLLRDNVWTSTTVTITVTVIDVNGNQTIDSKVYTIDITSDGDLAITLDDVTVQSHIPIVAGSPDASAPEITNFYPTPGGTLEASEVISFDIFDNIALGLVAVAASFTGGATELVHDGYNFRGQYLGVSNTRTAIFGGFHYTVLRSAGWTSAPTFEFFVIDNSGNLGEIV